ncbi:hypothetical protein Vadar_004333 [Vaccinium darrowii]|uniref:Uncharacterized protein n=1 Tax=Vaccinium darrowii TaxID=229202 RepID=A0ACB7YCN4_9ERIC|nr:hypothetical protein Vadar_004333 [Vaccinium darrowii]
MAATGRVIATVASTTATTSLLSRGSLRRSQVLSLCFNSSRLVPKKRLFTCTALYKPDVQIKEEGLPEFLHYRVFFFDNSGKKSEIFSVAAVFLLILPSLSQPVSLSRREFQKRITRMAAADRVIATVASTTATTSLLSRGSLRRSQVLSLCFNSSKLVPKKRLFTCNALYKPDV